VISTPIPKIGISTVKNLKCTVHMALAHLLVLAVGEYQIFSRINRGKTYVWAASAVFRDTPQRIPSDVARCPQGGRHLPLAVGHAQMFTNSSLLRCKCKCVPTC